jgi:hypothetical protein
MRRTTRPPLRRPRAIRPTTVAAARRRGWRLQTRFHRTGTGESPSTQLIRFLKLASTELARPVQKGPSRVRRAQVTEADTLNRLTEFREGRGSGRGPGVTRWGVHPLPDVVEDLSRAEGRCSVAQPRKHVNVLDPGATTGVAVAASTRCSASVTRPPSTRLAASRGPR